MQPRPPGDAGLRDAQRFASRWGWGSSKMSSLSLSWVAHDAASSAHHLRDQAGGADRLWRERPRRSLRAGDGSLQRVGRSRDHLQRRPVGDLSRRTDGRRGWIGRCPFEAELRHPQPGGVAPPSERRADPICRAVLRRSRVGHSHRVLSARSSMGRAGDEHRLLLNLWVRVAPFRRKSILIAKGSGCGGAGIPNSYVPPPSVRSDPRPRFLSRRGGAGGLRPG